MLLETLTQCNQQKKQIKLLNEKKMLDISIPNIDKVVKDSSIFLQQYFKIEEKFDGTKVTLFRNDTKWNKDYTKNWVIAFKHQILYQEEFNMNLNEVKQHSVGISQYGLIHKHLKEIHQHTKDIPQNTEFFIEFIQNKLTTTRDYKIKHKMYLIAHSNSKAEIEGGMIKTYPQGFHQDDIIKYSKILKLDIIPTVFKGYLDSVDNITNGIENDKLLDSWNAIKTSYNNNPLTTIKQALLGFESSLGGKTEGVVLHNSNNLFKFVQDDQYNKELRFSKKLKYQSDDSEIEKEYWSIVNLIADELISTIDFKTKYEMILKKISTHIYNLETEIIDKKIYNKLESMIDKFNDIITKDTIVFKMKDDLYLTTKQKIMDRLPENQNALFIGKMRIPTKAHISIIKNGLKYYNHIVVCIIKARKATQEGISFDLQEKILKNIFGKKITIISHSTGNLTSIINKSPKRIRYLLVGTDRVEDYNTQLKRHPSLSIIETPRNNNISATQLIQYIKDNNIEQAKSYLHNDTWKLYDIIKNELNF